MLPWAITRARADAIRVAGELRAEGLEAFPLPCIERRARPIAPWAPRGFKVGFFTSAGAVDAVALSLETISFDLIVALAPATRDALTALGRRVDLHVSGGALDLARATTLELGRRQVTAAAFWYPTSDLGERRDEQEQAVRELEGNGEVCRVVAYETRAPDTLADDVRTLPSAYGIVFTSPSTIDHFVAANAPRTPARVACWGTSTLTAARSHFPGAFELDRGRPLSESLAALEPSHV
ncbi:MAG: uroporphyrinogen-III synthase [Myxococcaceae bacterium]|nr:uroporphyrinogen-III synthase [Myxococcaceae bacterium]